MNRKLLLTLSLLLTFLPAMLRAEEWTSVDNATLPQHERVKQTDYEVWVKPLRGSHKWKPVKVWGALVSDNERRGPNWVDTLGHARKLMGFAQLIGEYPDGMKVRVRRQGAAFREVRIRPTDYQIPFRRIDGQTIELEIKNLQQRLSVEFDGNLHHNLFLIPDLPSPRPAGKGRGRVLYYGPGEHEVGTITLRSDDTLYIAQGAIVYGRVDAIDAHRIAIMGRGILCASGEVHDIDRRQNAIYMLRCSDVLIEGIMLRDSPSWSVNLAQCERVEIANMKHICWMRNSDGIDLCNCRHVYIHDCFLRNYDDNISLKNFAVNPNQKGPDNSITNFTSKDFQSAGTGAGQDLYDITMERCTLWADCAHNMLVGPESRADLSMADITFRDIIILEGHETAKPYTGTFAMMISDEGSFHDITFENITLDHVTGGQIFSIDYCTYVKTGRQARNITIRNIRAFGSENYPISVIHGLDGDHMVDGISVENMEVNGVKVTPENRSKYIDVNEFVTWK